MNKLDLIKEMNLKQAAHYLCFSTMIATNVRKRIDAERDRTDGLSIYHAMRRMEIGARWEWSRNN